MSLGLQATEGQAESSTSIAESLKAAAEEEVWKEAGFVYDSTSGLYYNYSSGYYYDPVSTFRELMSSLYVCRLFWTVS